ARVLLRGGELGNAARYVVDGFGSADQAIVIAIGRAAQSFQQAVREDAVAAVPLLILIRPLAGTRRQQLQEGAIPLPDALQGCSAARTCASVACSSVRRRM